MVIYTEGDPKLSQHVNEAYRVMYRLHRKRLLPSILMFELMQVRTSPGRFVVFTSDIQSPTVPKREFLGLNRRYGDSGIIVVKAQDTLHPTALVAHELVHQARGDELDAEVVEALVAFELGVLPWVGIDELEAFWEKPFGEYFELRRHRKKDGRRVFYFGDIPLWGIAPGNHAPYVFLARKRSSS